MARIVDDGGSFSPVPPLTLIADGSAIEIADAGLLFNADFSRSGNDLVLVGADGETILIVDYFATDDSVDLVSPDGAVLSADVIAALVGPLAPGQYAQTGTPEGSTVIGQVETLTGTATATRKDGTIIELKVGTHVFQGDVIQTGDGSSLGITFLDQTVFSLSDNARMILNELVYDPAGSSNSMLVSLVQGSFVFVAGQIAPTGDMKVQTPVATMGIRGTSPTVFIADDGTVAFSIIPDPGPEGKIGNYVLFDAQGQVIGNVTDTGSKLVLTSAAGQVQELPKTAGDFAQDQQIQAQVYSVFNSLQGRIDSGQSPVEQGSSDTDANSDTQDQSQNTPDDGSPDVTGAINATPASGGAVSGDAQGTTAPLTNVTAPLDETGGVPDGGPTVDPLGGAPGPVGGNAPVLPPLSDPTDNPVNTDNLVSGTPGVDLLNGTDGDDLIQGLGGTDFLSGGAGNDILDGGPGADELTGGAGADTFVLGADAPDFITDFNPGEDSLDLSNLLGPNFDIANINDFVEVQETGSSTIRVDSDGAVNGRNFVDVAVLDDIFAGDALSFIFDAQGSTGSVISAERNLAPVAQDDTFATDEDTGFNGGVFGDNGNGPDVDPENEQLIVVEVNGSAANVGNPIILASGALLTLNANGTFAYDPNGQFEGLNSIQNATDTFDYTLSDGKDGFDTATVTVNIAGVNDAPVTGVVQLATTEDSIPINGNFQATDVDGVVVSFDIVNQPAAGNVVNNNDGTFTFTPGTALQSLAAGTTQQLVFTFTATDNEGAVSAPGNATILVTGVNDAPIAEDDTVRTNENTILNGDVFEDNSDGEDEDIDITDVFTVSEVNGIAANVGAQITLESGALLTQDADGTFAYDPNGQFDTLGVEQTATDTYTYTIDDGNGGTDEATVTVIVRGVNNAPVAGNVQLAADEDGDVITQDFIASDVDSGVASFDIVTQPSNGSVVNNNNGTFTFDPGADFQSLGAGATQQLTFTFTATDNEGAISAPGTATITVTGVNDAPVANDDDVQTAENTVLNGDVFADNESGIDEDIDIGDAFTITEVNGEPDDIDTQITLDSGALLTLNSNGTFAYDPNGAFDALNNGDTDTDTFNYTIDDGNGGTGTATVTVTVNGFTPNAAPNAVDDNFGTDQFTGFTENVLADNGGGPDLDPDGDDLSVISINGQTEAVGNQISLFSGALLTLNTNGTFDYDPNGVFDFIPGGFTDTDSFIYTISDGSGGTSTATVTINIDGENDAPDAQDDALAINQNTVLNSDVFADNGSGIDSDIDGDAFIVSQVEGNPANVGAQITLESGALLTLNENGTFAFDPNGQFDALGVEQQSTETFTYTIDDGNGGTDTAVATITITGVNDAPVAQDDALATLENAILNGNVFVDNGNGADSDIDNADVFNISQINGNAAGVGNPITLASGALLTLNANGTFAYDPNGQFDALNNGQTATDTFDYTIDDGNGGTDTATATITVNGVTAANIAPVAEDDQLNTDQDTVVFANVFEDNGFGDDFDPNGDTIQITAVQGSGANIDTDIFLDSGAIINLENNGDLTYDPDSSFDFLGIGESIQDSFTYTISDGNGGFDTATVLIDVDGVNDDPVALDDDLSTDENTVLNADVFENNENGGDFDIDGDLFSVTELNGNAASIGNATALISGALVTLNADGTFAYDPNGQFEALGNGDVAQDNFDYTIADGIGGFATATVTIDIPGINDAPVAVDDEVSTDEDTVLSASVFDDNGNGSDFDLDDSLSVFVSELNGNPSSIGNATALTSGALVTLNADGSFDYDPNGQFEALGGAEPAQDSFEYTIEDGFGATSTATVFIDIDGVNDAPVAEDDDLSTNENTVLNGDVFADNEGGIDFDIDDGDVFTATELNGNSASIGNAATLASGALLTLNANGTFTYDPNGQFEALGNGDVAQDTFDYTIDDGNGGTDTATATINVQGANDAPVAQDDNFIGNEDFGFNGNVLDDNGNGPDSDPEDDLRTVTALNGQSANIGLQILLASGALLLLNANGSFAYNPNGAFEFLGLGQADQDSFEYTISDGNGGTSTATATIDVIGENDAPVAQFGPDEQFATVNFDFFTDFDPFNVFFDIDDFDTLFLDAVLDNGDDLPDWLEFDGTEFFGTPTATDGGTITVELTAFDEFGDSDFITFDITVLGDIIGTPGNDNLFGNLGANLVQALAGDDRIAASAGDDVIDGGLGNDTISFINNTQSLTVNLLTQSSTSFETGNDTLISIENIIGGAGDDNITGDGGNNKLLGRAGDDTIDGGAGDDVIDGGTGFNVLTGGAGNDILFGSVTEDGTGDNVADYALATGGITAILSGAIKSFASSVTGNASVGNDTLDNVDTIRGSEFADTFTVTGDFLSQFGDGFSQVLGRGGDDTIFGNGATRLDFRDANAGVTVDFEAALEDPRGLTGRAQLTVGSGGPGDNVGVDSFTRVNSVSGSEFDDVALGSNGPEFENFRMRGGNDIIDGRGGDNDQLDYKFSAPAGINADFTTNATDGSGTVQDGFGTVDTFSNIERIRGTIFDDIITGDGGNNQFRGEDGNDVIDGGGGDDNLRGDAGDDLLIGGDGNDFLTASSGSNTFIGGAGSDTLQGGGAIGVLISGGDIDTDINRADYSAATAGITVNLTGGIGQFASTVTGDASVGTDTLDRIDSFFGSDFADTFIVDASFRGFVFLGQADKFNQIEGRGGDDVITGNGTRLSYQSANSGVTVNLSTGIASLTTGVGGPGDNVGTDTFTGVSSINGSNFDDILTGSAAGFESFRGLAGNDTIIGGAGTDRADYRSSPTGVVVDLSAGAIGEGTAQDGFGTVDTLIGIENIRGSNFDDILIGDAGDNEFRPRVGTDVITGGGGIDEIRFSSFADNQTIDLSAGTATGSFIGNKTFTGIENARSGTGNDLIIGDAGDNVLRGGFGDNILIGGAGNDTLIGASTFIDSRIDFNRVDYRDATAGITVELRDGINSFTSTAVGDASVGTDILVNAEFIFGTSFADTFTIENTFNQRFGTFIEIEGGAGDDIITGFTGGETRAGYRTALDGVTVNLELGTAFSTNAGDSANIGIDTLTNVINVRGSNFGDIIIGSNGAQFETFRGQSGNDLIDGGGGASDQADYRNSPNGVLVDLSQGAIGSGFAQDGFLDAFGNVGIDTLINIERIRGSEFGDELIGDDGANRIQGRGGADLIEGRGGDDDLLGQDGQDLIRGGAGNDTITGGDGADTLFGGADDDNIDGGGGNDRLAGEAGTDTLTGGFGNDTFVLDLLATDLITDFNIFQDQLDLSGILNASFTLPALDDFVRSIDSSTSTIFSVDSDGAANGENFIDVVELTGVIAGDAINFVFDNQSASTSVVTIFSLLNPVIGTPGSDNLIGTSGPDELRGLEGDDTLQGLNGDDLLIGGSGADVLFGGDGRDIIRGGPGDDRLEGGSSDDVFEFDIGSGDDIISDFSFSDGDRIDLVKLGFIDIAELNIFDDGTNATINLSGSNTIFLENVLSSSLSSSDFNLASGLTVGSSSTGTLNIGGGVSTTGQAQLPPGAVLGDTVTVVGAVLGVLAGSTGSATITGAGSQFNISNGNLTVGLQGTGNLRVEAGGQVVIDSGNQDVSIGGDFRDLMVGADSGGIGNLTITGAGSTVTTLGTDTVARFGFRGGNGTLLVEDGGTLDTFFFEVGRDTGSTGVATVTGAGSTIIVSSENGVFAAPDDFEAGFARIGRSGGDGTLNILDGGRVEIREGTTNNTDKTGPGLQLGRLGATGSVLVDGSGSTLSITQNNPVGNSFGPFLQIGRGDNNGLLGGDGDLTISNGALVELIGEGSRVTLGARDVANGGVASGGTLDILSGGRLVIDGGAGVGTFAIASSFGTTGDVTLDGVNSSLTVTSGLEGFSDVGTRGIGTFNITGGATASFGNNSLNVGNRSAATGTIVVDGAGSSLSVDNGLNFGTEGTGQLTISSGATVTAGEFNLGLFASGTGSATVTDTGSSLDITGFFTVGNGQVSAEFGTPGATATGTLDILAGGVVTAQDLTIGQEINSVGTVLVSGSGSSLNLTGNLSVSGDGTGLLVVNDSAQVTAANVFVNNNGALEGNGTIISNVFVEGAIAAGTSVGALTIDGSFTLNGGTIETEISGTTAGTGFDVLNVTGNAALNSGQLLFDFEGFTPTAGDSFRFVSSVATSGNANNLSIIIEGLAAGFEFDPLVFGATGATITAANTGVADADVLLFFGGSLDDAFTGGSGNDVLDGGFGNDLLIGGGGTDTLTGGFGNDTFVLDLLATDLITDFDIFQDQLDLSGILNVSFTLPTLDDFVRAIEIAGNTTIQVDSDGALNGENFLDVAILNNVISGDTINFIFDGIGNITSVESVLQLAPGTIQLSALDGTNGFVINGIDAGDLSGFSVSSAGDINGDGFDDVIIGASRANPNGANSGESYVVFGQAGAFGASFELSALDGTNGFVINGIDAGDQSGISVSSAGDINSDGFDDVIISALAADPNGNLSGESYVVFGQAGAFGASLDLSALDGTNGFVINGIDIGDTSGNSVSSVGDINGDGFDDVIISATQADPNGDNSGESYVVFGQAGVFSASLELSTLDGTNGFVINGIDADDRSGVSVSSAGDINGDGIDDLIIGASQADANGNNTGESYVVFGQTGGFGPSLELSALDGSDGFVINGIDAGDQSGASVSSAGDINGDGIDDLIIGAFGADPNGSSGESYVVFGQTGGFAASLELSALDGTNGFVINGIDAFDGSGASVSSAGDINGDGIDDVIIGASRADPNGFSAGESYVVFGQAGGFAASLELSALDGTNGFVIIGSDAGDESGVSVSSAGDINGDGFDDLIIGASLADPNGDSSGESYIIFGEAFGNGVILGTPGSDNLIGTSGADIIRGLESDDTLQGVDGDDILDGGAGSDTLTGGLGSDTFKFADTSAVDTVLDFNIAEDQLDLSALFDSTFSIPNLSDFVIARDLGSIGNTTIQVDSDGAANGINFVDVAILNGVAGNTDISLIFDDIGTSTTLRSFIQFVGIFGTPGEDNLVGTGLRESIFSFEGNDQIFAGDGGDQLDGGTGQDDLFGEGGNDRLFGGEGIDTLTGGAGSDTFVLDLLGADTVTDFTTGGGVVDTLNLSTALDPSFTGANVNDFIRISESGGNSTVSVDSDGLANGENFIVVGNLIGIVENNNISILFNNGLGNTNVTVTAGSGFNNITGTPFDDDILGTLGADLIDGLGGEDLIFGLDGDDLLFGGPDLDLLLGGAGNDELDGGPGTNALIGGAGFDLFVINSLVTNVVVDFTIGDDTLDLAPLLNGFSVPDKDDFVRAINAGSDTIIRVDSDGSLNGEDFTTVAILSGIGLGSSIDFLFDVLGGSSTVTSTAPASITFGTSGDNTIVGTAADEFIDALAGEDIINGGPSSSNVLTGGADSDRFVLDLQGVDLITDFDSAIDFLDLSGPLLAGGSFTIQALEDFVDVTDLGGVSVVGIDSDGTANGEDFVFVAVLSNVVAGQQISFIFDAIGTSTTTQSFAIENIISGTPAGETLTGTSDDDFIIAFGGDDTLIGLGGEDVLEGGAGSDDLDGGDGNDFLFGGAGIDTLFGGDGFDVFEVDLAGADDITDFDTSEDLIDLASILGAGFTINTASDFVRAVEDDGQTFLTVDSDGAANGENFVEVADLGFSDVFTGDNINYRFDDNDNITSVTVFRFGSNFITGTPGIDVLDGIAGDDVIFGLGDDDTLTANLGSDTVLGGDGDDTLIAGPGFHTLSGDVGADTFILLGDNSTTIIDFTEGVDTLDLSGLLPANFPGGPTDSFIIAGGDFGVTNLFIDIDGAVNGEDFVEVATLFGFSAGDPITFLFDGNPTTINVNPLLISGDALDNIIDGTALAETISGLGGNDTLRGNGGRDTLNGGDGNDRLEGGGDNDTLTGNAGQDTFVLDNTSIDQINDFNITDDVLDITGAINAGVDVQQVDFFIQGGVLGGVLSVFIDVDGSTNGENFIQIARIFGVSAGSQVNFISESGTSSFTAIDNQFNGSAGPDVFVGSFFNEQINGNNGDDDLSGLGGDDSFDGGNGADTISGGDGDDFVRGKDGNDTIFGGAGNDFINGDDDDDLIFGDAGNDDLDGALGNDTINGGDGDDELNGSSGNDILRGDAGNDFLDGRSGVDDLQGGIGDDFLSGGSENDTLDGGDGNDQLAGGGGDNLVTGGSGFDVFILDDTFGAARFDTITDYNPLEDILDLSDLLEANFTLGSQNDFIEAVDDGLGNAEIRIDVDGAGETASFEAVALLEGIVPGVEIDFIFNNLGEQSTVDVF